MSIDNQPFCGKESQLNWLVCELQKSLAMRSIFVVGTKSVVSEYMSYGYSIGFSRSELEVALKAFPNLQKIAINLTEDDVAQGKPPPDFQKGELVEVIVNAKNTTYRKGVILDLTWHHKKRKWIFLIEENGKKISKRYEKEDLHFLSHKA